MERQVTEHNSRYGYNHRKLRKQVAPMVAAGKANCWRCGERIDPGTDWDLGHKDNGNAMEYMGPEHPACNRATTGRQTSPFTGPPVDTSRRW
jgi:hypothetical protein